MADDVGPAPPPKMQAEWEGLAVMRMLAPNT